MKKIKWKTLGEICGIFKGEQLNKKDMLKIATYPVINGGTSPSGYIENYNQKENTITISQGGSAGYVNFIETKFWLSAHAFAVVPNDKVSKKYIYHFLKENQYKLENKKVGATIPNISKNDVQNFLISFPPLKKQAEIAETLDKFTELTEELTAREAQYNYYRNMLLSQEWIEREEGKEVEWKRLEEICKILDSKRKPITRKNRIEGIYPYYGANGIKSFIKDYIFDETLILMGEDGSVMDKNKNPVLHWIDNQKIWVNNHAHVLGQSKNKYNLKYIYYFLSTIDVSKIVKGLPLKLNQSNLRKIKILIPSFKTQQKIVDFLDNFEALVKDIKQGLPKEIELRQKQYKYYREKLLTFEKK